MKTIKQLFILAIAFLLATSCDDEFRIRGNGIIETEGRSALDFDYVASSGNFDVHITPGDEFEIIVSAESNLLPYIKTDFIGSTLHINVKGVRNLQNTFPMEIYLTTPTLNGASLSGSGTITTGFFEANEYHLAISGSGYIETAVDCNLIEASISGSGGLSLAGDANTGIFNISASGEIESYDLTLDDCHANISGSGNMWVNVDEFLLARISGSGNVFYIGNPEVELHVSGSGSVIHDN